MGPAGQDASARARAHYGTARRYMNSGNTTKAAAHFGRAMHYGAHVPLPYDAAIRIFADFVMSSDNLYPDEQGPSVQFPTGGPSDEATYNELVHRGYKIESGNLARRPSVSSLVSAKANELGPIKSNERPNPASSKRANDEAERKFTAPRSVRKYKQKQPDSSRKSTPPITRSRARGK